MTVSERRLLLPFLRRVQTGASRSVSLEAQKLLARFGKLRKALPLRKIEKKQKRLAKREETAAIRAAVFERARGSCELCESYPSAELHHLESGIGRRLKLQAIENCVAVCTICHRAYHREPESFGGWVRAWAARHGYPIPTRFRRAA